MRAVADGDRKEHTMCGLSAFYGCASSGLLFPRPRTPPLGRLCHGQICLDRLNPLHFLLTVGFLICKAQAQLSPHLAIRLSIPICSELVSTGPGIDWEAQNPRLRRPGSACLGGRCHWHDRAMMFKLDVKLFSAPNHSVSMCVGCTRC